MKNVFIALLCLLMIFIGIFGLVFTGSQTISWWTALYVLLGFFVTLPAMEWWKKYFTDLFNK